MMMKALPQTLNPSKTKLWKLKDYTMKLKKGKFKDWMQKIKEWNHKMKECTIKSYPLIEKDISNGILPS